MSILFNYEKEPEKLDLLLESKSEESTIQSYFEKLYGHMLKLKYQEEKYLQSNTWIDTIINSSKEINKICKKATLRNKAINELQFKGYKNGIKIAEKDTKGKLNKQNIPNELPNEWNYANVIDLKFIFNFMDKYTIKNTSAYKQLQDKHKEYNI